MGERSTHDEDGSEVRVKMRRSPGDVQSRLDPILQSSAVCKARAGEPCGLRRGGDVVYASWFGFAFS